MNVVLRVLPALLVSSEVCDDEPRIDAMFLQMQVSNSHSFSSIPVLHDESEIEIIIDMNGRKCLLCTLPFPERSDRTYVQRTDCGNQSLFERPENMYRPIIQFNRPHSTAYCELNWNKACADGIYNQDWLFFAKSLDMRTARGTPHDQIFCKLMGWLSPELRALQHNYQVMKEKAEEFCNSLDTNWTTMTMADSNASSSRSYARGYPTKEEALLMAGWTCAMGTAACDMAYCAYSFCELPDGTMGTYGQCKGWDPVKGMPL